MNFTSFVILKSRDKCKMETIPADKYLQFNPNCLENIRKLYNLTDTDVIKESINLLRNWIDKQDHFVKKDFDVCYLERMLILAKGSVEKVKKQLDTMCTTKTMLPQYFRNVDTKKDLLIHQYCSCIVLPQQTEDYRRVYILKVKTMFDVRMPQMYDLFIILNIYIAEYLLQHDYITGLHIILDITDVNPIDVISTIGIQNVANTSTVFVESYPCSLKGVYIISPSKFLDKLVSVIKSVVTSKITDRVHAMKTPKELYDFIPKKILPKDYGGEEKCIDELRDELFDIITCEEHVKSVKEMNEAVTNESHRKNHKFCEEYAGLPGTFRLLKVD